MPTLDDAVDGLGLGFGQYIIVFLGGEIYSGLIKTLVTTCSTSFSQDLGFSNIERGWLVSMVFLGNLTGNLSSGALSNFWGRRPTILLGYCIAATSLLGSVLMLDLYGALAFRFGFGLAAGVMGPTCWTLLGEIAPSQSRHWMHSVCHFTWFLGAVSVMLVVHSIDPTMKEIPWRHLTLCIFCVVLTCLMVGIHFLVESPSYLCLMGRRQDAIASLEVLQKRNGSQGDVRSWELRPTDTQANDRNLASSYLALFDRMSLYTTLTLAFCTFTLNYSGYGIMYALPIILQRSKLGVLPSTIMTLSFVCGFLGVVSGVPASKLSKSRTGFLACAFLVRAVFLCSFLVGIWRGDSGALTVALALSGIFGKTLLDSIVYVLVYLYAIEVRPTHSRASGSGFALGVGRLGGVVAPIVFELMPGSLHFIGSVFVLGLVCAAFVSMLPIETKDRQLGDIADEVTVLPKLGQA